MTSKTKTFPKWGEPENEDILKYSDEVYNEDKLEIKRILKMKMTSKNKLKNVHHLKKDNLKNEYSLRWNL